MKRNKEKYKFIDLFCGIGGFRIGFEKNNFECVFSSDNNKNCQLVYQQNFGEIPYGDITRINPEIIPDFDVLTGGFPCQPFSISGKKKGFEDSRGTLFFDICRIIESKNPKIIVLENVKHFIYHNKKETLKNVIRTLNDLGYNVVYKILNLTNFGLPQNRERIFIIGTKKGIFDFNKLDKKKSNPLRDFLIPNHSYEYLKKNEYTLLNEGVFKKQPLSGLIFIGYRNKKGFQHGIRPNSEHLNRVHRQPNRIYSIDGYHPTIPSQESSGRFFIYIPELNKVRKLSIDECYKIMGFPKDFIKHHSLGIQYKQIGNSVGIPLIEEISNQIINQKLLDKKFESNIKGLDRLIYQW